MFFMVETCGFSTKALCLLCTGPILERIVLACVSDCQYQLHSQRVAMTFSNITVISGYGPQHSGSWWFDLWDLELKDTFSLRLLGCLAHTSVAVKLQKFTIGHDDE